MWVALIILAVLFWSYNKLRQKSTDDKEAQARRFSDTQSRTDSSRTSQSSSTTSKSWQYTDSQQSDGNNTTSEADMTELHNRLQKAEKQAVSTLYSLATATGRRKKSSNFFPCSHDLSVRISLYELGDDFPSYHVTSGMPPKGGCTTSMSSIGCTKRSIQST